MNKEELIKQLIIKKRNNTVILVNRKRNRTTIVFRNPTTRLTSGRIEGGYFETSEEILFKYFNEFNREELERLWFEEI